MPDTKSNSEGASPNDVILTEIKGLRDVVDARFDHVEKEQDGLRDWLGRITTSMERVTETVSRQVLIESRQARSEGDISDLKLDVAGLETEIAAVKDQKTKSGLILNAIVGFVSAAASAIGVKYLTGGGS